jgi:hypothetical protein
MSSLLLIPFNELISNTIFFFCGAGIEPRVTPVFFLISDIFLGYPFEFFKTMES